jgi:DNA repair protein RecO (recombination protein O)
MYYAIKGLVLNAKILGEYDKLITVYSYEWGKICAIVPSAKKITAKLSYATDPLTESEFMTYQNHPNVRPTITGSVILNNNARIKTDIKRNLYALYAAEICNKLTPFNLVNEEKYILISRIWEVMAACKKTKRALCAFALRILKLSGYAFFDYLKDNNSFIGNDIKTAVKKLSNCYGGDIDAFEEIDDDKVWNCIESYLSNYIRRPALSIFLEKIGWK